MAQPKRDPLFKRIAADRARWRARLERFSLRFHVLLIVVATCGFAALVSRGLLALGLDHLGLRYGVVVVASYAAFCALVRLWIAIMRRLHAAPPPASSAVRNQANSDTPFDALDLVPSFRGQGSGGSAGGGVRWSSGGGGDFAGGGASGSFEMPAAAALAESSGGGSSSGSSSSGRSFDIGDALDGDGEGGLVLLVVLAVAALLASAVLVVLWIGPGMLVEAGLASFVTTGLARRSIFDDDSAWLGVVLRKTWWIAALILVGAIWAGTVIERHAPGVRTAGEAVRWALDHPAQP